MADYIHTATVLKPESVTAFTSVQDAADANAFEAVRASALRVVKVEVADTTFYIHHGYQDFASIIADPVTWSDVRYIDNMSRWNLYLVKGTP